MPAFILSFLAQLRFRTLFLVTATIFVTDLLIPDLIPFVDELLLGAMTLLFSAWKRRREPIANAPPPLPHAPDR
ncbi:MAG: hypothetical protein KA505_07770 [Xanthomonadales bacterium]|nr:hypothetical protein [Xanthomonadales bacterium]MBP7622842.1 hypothetical protein [Xanthomonadales bacterium]